MISFVFFLIWIIITTDEIKRFRIFQVITCTLRHQAHGNHGTTPKSPAWLHYLESPVWSFITTCMEATWEHWMLSYVIDWFLARAETKETSGTCTSFVSKEQDLRRWERGSVGTAPGNPHHNTIQTQSKLPTVPLSQPFVYIGALFIKFLSDADSIPAKKSIAHFLLADL